MKDMHTLDDVLAQLATVIATCKQENSPLGYFPALYYAMTAEVRADVRAGRFDDGARMEQLDVVFAKRYFSAWEAWRSGQAAPRSWTVAFEAVANRDLIVLQHLLLGVHAHINFDLGVAAAEVAPGAEIAALESDFNRINDIIARLTDRVQARLTEIWLPFGPLDRLLRTKDEGLINFSTKAARKSAWLAAQSLAFLSGEAAQQFIAELDASVAFFAEKITRPGLLIGQILPLVRGCEQGSAADKIEVLQAL